MSDHIVNSARQWPLVHLVAGPWIMPWISHIFSFEMRVLHPQCGQSTDDSGRPFGSCFTQSRWQLQHPARTTYTEVFGRVHFVCRGSVQRPSMCWNWIINQMAPPQIFTVRRRHCPKAGEWQDQPCNCVGTTRAGPSAVRQSEHPTGARFTKGQRLSNGTPHNPRWQIKPASRATLMFQWAMRWHPEHKAIHPRSSRSRLAARPLT